MSIDIRNVINDVVMSPEAEQTWESMCEYLAENKQDTLTALFEEGYIPPKQATILPDGSLEVYALGKGGKISMHVPSKTWAYRTLH